ncbi:MAG TPA: HAD hydrolase-like protein [Candidatus Saccharimonadales bacterium]|nr:HAD hydrolase-like protein [Candidatus Saccharimonadales bacterium]
MAERAAFVDVDGTVVDNFESYTEILAEVLQRPPLSADEIQDIRSLPLQENLHRLDIKPEQIPGLLNTGRLVAARDIGRAVIFDGMPEALEDLRKLGYDRFAFSSNGEDTITTILAQHGIELEDVIGGVDFNKAERLAASIEQKGLDLEQCVSIGDTGRDIAAAREVGIRSVAVAWGYSEPELLATYSPDVIVSMPTELPKAVESVFK